jgi:hypothetical protein
MTNSATEIKIEITWEYTPDNFFEEPVTLKKEHYSIEIHGGQITARMSADFFDSQPSLRDSLTDKLKYYFLGAQLIRRRAFEIRGGSINRVRPDGRRDTTRLMHSAEMIMTADSPDLSTADGQGSIHDTRQDRIDITKNLAELSVRHGTDPTARKMLNSFNNSVNEPEIALMRLYEVWEAVVQAFGGKESNARDTLGISYGRLVGLANDKRLYQGRHRGQQIGPQRDATSAELEEARGIDLDMIVKYLSYLDEQQKAK